MTGHSITKRDIERAVAWVLNELDPARYTVKPTRDISEDFTTYWIYQDDKAVLRAEIFLPTEDEGGHVIFRDPYESNKPPLDKEGQRIQRRIQPELEGVFARANAMTEGEEAVAEAAIGDGEGKAEQHQKKRSSMWGDTSDKLARLRKLRVDWIQEKNEIPKWTYACHQIPIDPKTAKKHDPELRERWEDKEFREL